MSRDFSGTDGNRVTVGDVAAIDITGTLLTIAARVMLDAAGDGAIASKWSSGQEQYILYVDSLFRLAAAAQAGGFINDTVALSTGQWYHAVYRLNGTNGHLFKDGSQVASGSNPTMTNRTSSLMFGQQSSGESNTLNGKIAEVGIWDVALSTDEVVALSKGFSPALVRPQSLKGYWPLVGKASPEPDLRNGNSGTIVGTVPAADHPRVYVPRSAIYTP